MKSEKQRQVYYSLSKAFQNIRKTDMRKKPKTCDNRGIGNWNGDDDNEHVFDEEKAYRAIAMFTCTADVPPKAFEYPSFKDLVDIFNPQFNVSFANIERHCLDIYEVEKSRIKQLLGSLDGQISLSLDVTRHEGRNVSDYMCLTAHFVDGDWKQKNWVINFSRVWYTLDECPEIAILKSLSELDFEGKIATVTSAKRVEYDETVEVLRKRVQEKKTLQLKGQIFRVRCCADTFRRMVEDAFEKIQFIILKVRLLVYWRNSILPLWCITFHKLQQAIELESAGEYTKKDDYFGFDIPSAKEWNKIRGVCKLVGSVYNAAEVLFETKYPTASIYLQNIWELRASLTEDSASSDSFLKAMAQKMLKKLDKYWKDMFLVLAVTTVMDPRCKMKYIEFASMKYEGSAGNSQAATVLEAIQSLFDDYAAHNLEAENAAANDSTSSDSSYSDLEDDLAGDIKERHQNPNFGFKCLDEYNQYIESNSQPLKSELEWYLEEPVMPWSQNFKLLSWWKAASPKYPILSKMARDFLAIPLTLATSDEAFYSELRKPDTDLICLSPELMNALMCTRSWFEKH
ncbi:hypothetical protein ACSBR1_014015 [Camellia fascicularis]